MPMRRKVGVRRFGLVALEVDEFLRPCLVEAGDHAVLGVAVAAYEQWLDDPAADIGGLLDDGMRQLDAAFTGSLQ